MSRTKAEKNARRARAAVKRHRRHVKNSRPTASPMGWLRLRSPPHMNFRHEDDATFRFLRKIYEAVVINDRKVTVDLSPLRTITWGASLALVAEMNRAEEIRPGSIVAGMLPKDRALVQVLTEVGFIEVTTPNSGSDMLQGDIGFLKMRTGVAEDTEDLRFLDEFLARTIPAEVLPDRVRGRLKGAIKEALLNVVDHAYEMDFPERVASKRWWMCGRADPDGSCQFVVYDLGAGIPCTVPISKAERVREAYQALQDDERKQDFQLIKAAVATPHSRTGLQGRGRGLPEMRRLIDRVENGMLSISSGRGHYVYSRGAEEVDGGVPMNHHLHGTLVVWRLRVSDALDDDGGHDG